ncbi:MAG: hypothetical protein ABJE47_10160 [bacterium]
MRSALQNRHLRAAFGIALVASAAITSNAVAQSDPRVGLKPGINDAGEAAKGMELVGHGMKPDNMQNASNPGDFGFLNSDLAFQGKFVFQGSFNGFQIWDVSNVTKPALRMTFVCPGGQGDPSVYGHLLFISVEETRGRVDCGAQGVTDSVSKDRFRGVRIFDITDMDHPKQIAAVQTCRGSHTHTLVVNKSDKNNLYLYVSGTAPARSPSELAGCSGKDATDDANTSRFRIDVIQVPLAAPQNARIVSNPRIFATGTNIAGLWKGGNHGEGTQTTSGTDQCHDITVYAEMGLAAGACSGNGIVLDIKDPVHPKRIAEVSDPNFAYWHSATFSNDAKKVVYTDEWGGGTQPKCQSTDKLTWGADAIFSLDKGKMTPGGYFKVPAPQTATENCVAHNGMLIPVPGRDIMAQGWYQGGLAVFDFTDVSHPVEIAYFDRGPMSADKLYISGEWAAYWYNGNVYASEIGRGLDILQLKPTDMLSQNEIDAAKLITSTEMNPQAQTKIVWPASFSVSRAYLDQLGRNSGLASDKASKITADLDAAEKLSGGAQKSALNKLASSIQGEVKGASDQARVRALAESVKKLAESK